MFRYLNRRTFKQVNNYKLLVPCRYLEVKREKSGSETSRERTKKELIERKKKSITLLGLGSNVSLALGKFFIGLEIGSSALIADAVHQASDAVSDCVVLGSLTLASRSADEKQPFGYGHFDTLASFVLGLTLVGAGVGSGYFAVDNLVLLLRNNEIPMTGTQSNYLAATSILLTVFVKEWLFRINLRLGKETHSSVLIANAWHHRTDSLSSIVAGFGILGSVYGFPILDPVAALAVSGMVMKAGLEIAWESVGDLTDRQTTEDHKMITEKIQQITDKLSTSTEIVGVHDVHLRRMGGVRYVDLHVVVDTALSTTASYQAGQRLRQAILDELPDITEVFIHVDAGQDAFTGQDQSVEINRKVLPPVKSPYQIEAEVRKVVFDLRRTRVRFFFLDGVSHVNVHYVVQSKNQPAKIIVEVNLLVNSEKYSNLRFGEIDEAGRVLRRELLSRIEELDSVDLHVQLSSDEDDEELQQQDEKNIVSK